MSSTSTSTEATPTPPNVRRPRRDGGQNFTILDKQVLLDFIEKVKPVGPWKWDEVADL
ncbi:hypothetical protein V1525DRAFT_391590 [Lipomyces kononenkoae]|uniref:Uncharacterized protein n=1 Tax=Lipomyces kononenkoae TaxID=34357 RepID=A0ACC3SSE6_LIPKO